MPRKRGVGQSIINPKQQRYPNFVAQKRYTSKQPIITITIITTKELAINAIFFTSNICRQTLHVVYLETTSLFTVYSRFLYTILNAYGLYFVQEYPFQGLFMQLLYVRISGSRHKRALLEKVYNLQGNVRCRMALNMKLFCIFLWIQVLDGVIKLVASDQSCSGPASLITGSLNLRPCLTETAQPVCTQSFYMVKH